MEEGNQSVYSTAQKRQTSPRKTDRRGLNNMRDVFGHFILHSSTTKEKKVASLFQFLFFIGVLLHLVQDLSSSYLGTTAAAGDCDDEDESFYALKTKTDNLTKEQRDN